MPAMDKVRVGVVGVGALGYHHARVYAALPQAKLVGVADKVPGRAEQIALPLETVGYTDYRQLFGKVDAVSIATPTTLHGEIGEQFLDEGVHVLVEKPIADSLEEADRLIRAASRNRKILQVAHLERFNPAVRATLPLITQPMFFEIHRLSVFTPRSLDIDVVLDLMIHDLDIVLAFVHSPVKEIRAVGLPILSDKVDIANVRVEFESGCVANFTASRVSTERVRKLRLFQPGQYISIDYGRQDVMVFSVGDAAGLVATPSVNPQIQVGKPAVTAEEPLLAEISSFLQRVRDRSKPVVSLEDGARALELALAILSAIKRHAGKIGVAK